MAATEHEQDGAALGNSGRTFWFSSRLNDKTLRRDLRRRVTPPEANIVASLCENGQHMPTLDVDHPVLCVPSSSPGHYHLFVDVPMSWRSYRRLLRALYLGGVIGRNAYWRSLDRGASFVRPPGVHKTQEEIARSAVGRTAARTSATRALWLARARVAVKRIGWNVSELSHALRDYRKSSR